MDFFFSNYLKFCAECDRSEMLILLTIKPPNFKENVTFFVPFSLLTLQMSPKTHTP